MQVSVPVHPEFPYHNMGVQVPQEEGKLKKDNAPAPDEIAATKLGQKYFGNYQLYLEEQKSRQKTERIEIVNFLRDLLHGGLGCPYLLRRCRFGDRRKAVSLCYDSE